MHCTYSTAQLKVGRTLVWHGPHTTRLSFYTSASVACAHKIDEVEPIVQSTCVHTRCVYNSLQKSMCLLGTYTTNLVHVHLGKHANCKPKICSSITSMNAFMY